MHRRGLAPPPGNLRTSRRREIITQTAVWGILGSMIEILSPRIDREQIFGRAGNQEFQNEKMSSMNVSKMKMNFCHQQTMWGLQAAASRRRRAKNGFKLPPWKILTVHGSETLQKGVNVIKYLL